MFGKKTIKLASILLALLLTLSLSSCGLLAFIGSNNSSGGQNNIGGKLPIASDSAFPELDLIDYFFEQLSVLDLDRDKLVTAILKAYVEATGDIYAAYYTEEELKAMTADNQGELEGIGVSVVNNVVEHNGQKYNVLTIISVFNNSPALAGGLRVGDHVYAVFDEDGNSYTVDELGYDTAITYVRGVAGTKARFVILRNGADGMLTAHEFEIERQKIMTESVTGRVSEQDPTIGIVKISQFDLTTPPQFERVMDELIAGGCQKFVFDVRNNPGGDLASIEAVLSMFLNEGDVMIQTVYKDGMSEVDKVGVVTHTDPSYSSCDVTREDIGKYRNYRFAVLTNEYTASAAELFTSNLRDYELATLVGNTTYGKGCMQSTYNLAYWGVSGGLKLTTAWYLPPSGENYHEIGIVPHIEVDMDESLIEQYGNIYLIPDSEDPQLIAAIQALK
jgi:carboxyl-terminal processing protease